MSTERYPLIRRWGNYLHSFDYYIKNQIALAIEDGAPEDAVYKRGDRWVTGDEITSSEARHFLGLDPL